MKPLGAQHNRGANYDKMDAPHLAALRVAVWQSSVPRTARLLGTSVSTLENVLAEMLVQRATLVRLCTKIDDVLPRAICVGCKNEIAADRPPRPGMNGSEPTCLACWRAAAGAA